MASLLGSLARGVDGNSAWLSRTRRRRRLCSALSHGVTRTRRRRHLCMLSNTAFSLSTASCSALSHASCSVLLTAKID
ncbi:uncharacterized protein G2W53_008023 [Senna tora]|uniref:Uncharacterized protein n=1 Tax=Senna tora TaxID=362788 RepID=A0A834X750_9FABA|nr:uncharacterized protein G2W53_008023 [Senna tora]